MNTLKLVCLTVFLWIKQACTLPFAIATEVRQCRRRAALNEMETERLDRIRNPSKYLGK
jgi:hypothetical protein